MAAPPLMSPHGHSNYLFNSAMYQTTHHRRRLELSSFMRERIFFPLSFYICHIMLSTHGILSESPLIVIDAAVTSPNPLSTLNCAFAIP